VALGALCGFGMALYFVLVHVTGAQPMGLLLRRLRRGA
jgi:putative peptidoglycan lipid II flippase